MRTFFVIFIALLVNICLVRAQFGSFGSSDARTMGMGNTGNASANDVYSIGKNPSLLDNSDSNKSYLKIIFPNISSQVFTTSISLDEVDYFFGGPTSRNLTYDEKNRLYGYFAKENGIYNYYIEVNPITIAYKPDSTFGSVAFSVSDVVSGNFVIPSSLAQLLLNGNEPSKNYSFDALNFQTWWLREYNLSYSRKLFGSDNGFLKNLSAGISFKLISGFAYTGITNVSSNFYTGDKNVLIGNYDIEAYSSFSNNLAVQYDYDTVHRVYNLNYFSQPSGSGFGLDFGLSAQIGTGIVIGAAITDIGSVKWTGNVAKHASHDSLYINDLFDKAQLDSLTNFVKSESTPVGSYSTSLPTTLRFGISADISNYIQSIPGNLKAAFDYNQGLNKMPSNSILPRFSLGFDWFPLCHSCDKMNPDGISTLTGLTYDQSSHARWAMGIGYVSSFIEVYLSTLDIISLIAPNSTKPHESFAFNLAWKIKG